MEEPRLRARRWALLALTASVLVVAALVGYTLGAVRQAPLLRRADPPPQQIELGSLQSPVSIPSLCASSCAPSP